MFSGIVQQCCPVSSLIRGDAGVRLGLSLPVQFLEGLAAGASVAVNGVCLTVTSVEAGQAWFDAVPGTLARTNLGALEIGRLVNVERSLGWGAEVGGHAMSGHVTATAAVIDMNEALPQPYLDFTVPIEYQRYIFVRGYIALDGCSLTIAEEDDMGIYRVNLIPETLRQTNLSGYKPGDRLNFEVDHQTMVVVETVERVLGRRRQGRGFTGL